MNRNTFKDHVKVEGRYAMKTQTGEYTESGTKDKLKAIRASDPRFKFCRITHALQVWADVVKVNVIYPATVQSRAEFRRYNAQEL
jgi:hypothetical protein